MKDVPFHRSLRFKLVLASILVEFVMLTILVGNSVRVMEHALLDQAELRLQELKPLLNATLAPALAERDFAKMEEVLRHARRENGIVYLVLFDNAGKVAASEGWQNGRPLPSLDTHLGEQDDDSVDRFDTEIPVTLAGKTYGKLRFGVSTKFLTEAKASILQQSRAIASLEILISFALLMFLGYWMMRHLGILTDATAEVRAGNFDVRLPVKNNDEVGRLTVAFNTMAAAVRSRIDQMSASEARFHAIADFTYGWENWIGPDGHMLWVNSSVERVIGYTPEECLRMETFPLAVIAEDDLSRATAEFRNAIRGGAGKDFEFRVKRKDGSLLWVEADWQPIYGVHGEYLGIRSSIRDISARKEAELRLRAALAWLQQSEEMQRRYLMQSQEEQARLNSLLAAMNLGILFVGTDNRVMYYNPAFLRTWMIRSDTELVGMEIRDLINHSANVLARPDHYSEHVMHVLGTHEVSENFEVTMTDGRLVTQLSYPVHDREGRFIGRLWIYEDITRERQTAEQLIYLAERDSLTGLFNRHRFQEELSRMIVDTERHKTSGALLFFDLDEFKYINDTFGHRAGDAMLIRVASEVSALIRRNEIFSRLGGDEFALLIPDVAGNEAEALAERVVRAISQIPFRFEGQNLRLTTSLGIAMYPQHADNVEDLIAHADAAMYQAKDVGKNGWRIYRPDLDASREMISRMTWSDRITHALENGLLRLHFQGIYHAGNGKLAHLEALVRMVDKDDGETLIMPGHFIPFAEKSGKVLNIDRWVLRESICLLASSKEIPPLAVNISGRSFDEPTLPQYIAEQLAHYKVEPHRLYVELTETAAVSDLHDAQRFIEALHRTGCGVCLDDFGAGFSSFAYLKHLRADTFKIDGLFIRDLPNDRDNQVFVKSMVDVARGLHKTTIAEFVESAETLAMLKEFGVDMVQGYYLDMPQAKHPAIAGSCENAAPKYGTY
jgi:diguanylate cyclase (GGDEF)-like protein/PAS domain S-box-containing protein